MNNMRQLVACLLVLILNCQSLYAESPRDLVAAGNRAYHTENFEEAIAAYEKASVDLPESAHLYFNKGAALYRSGDYKKAIEMFASAASKTKELSLEARSKYNQGNCFVRESERQRESDLQKSLEALKSSILHYQQALKLDPTLEDAAHNIEVVRLTIKAVLDQIKQQEEQNKKKEEQREKALKQLEKLAKQQEELAKKTQGLDRNSSEHTKQCNNLAAEQREIGQETQELKDALSETPGDSSPPIEQAKEQLEKSIRDQQRAAENLDRDYSEKAVPDQQKAAQKMREALELLRGEKQKGDNSQKGSSEQKQQQQSQPKPNNQDSQQTEAKQEANPNSLNEEARDILQKEEENRRRRQSATAYGHRPVDKDW